MNYHFQSILKSVIIIILLFINIVDIFAEEDIYEVEVILEKHVFIPAEVIVPARKKIKLVIHNVDPTIEEFDSIALKREKFLASNSKTNIILAPLVPGRYDFMGEFHQETAKGTIIAIAAEG